MNESALSLRDRILLHDVFTYMKRFFGIGVEHFRQFEPLWDFTAADIAAELEAMRAEGLVKGDGWHSATTAGQAEREGLLRRLGRRRKALVDQRHFDPHSLILALVDCGGEPSYLMGNEGRHIGSDEIRIYLSDLTPEEIEEALSDLIKQGLVRSYESFSDDETRYALTADGKRHYHREVRSGLDLGANDSILDEITIGGLPLGVLGYDDALVQDIERRWMEAQKCIHAEAPLAASILLASIVEGLLLAQMKAHPKLANTAAAAPRTKPHDSSVATAKPFAEWTLADMITVAAQCGWVTGFVAAHAHVLRDVRNLVHPHVAIVAGERPSIELNKIELQVVETIVADLSAWATREAGSGTR